MKKFDAVNFLKDYKIPSATSGPNTHAGWIAINCPFCIPPDDLNHGGFHIAKGGYFNCWKCGGKPLKLVIKELLVCSEEKALYVLKKYQVGKIKIERKKKVIFDVTKELILPDVFSKLHGDYRKYLINRNFNPDYLEEKYDLMASNHLQTKFGDYRYRIIAPIYYKHKIVSFQGRDITNESDDRWKTLSKQFEIIHHKHIFYNMDNAKKNTVLVVEGLPDNWRIGNDCISSFGTSLTPQQIELLSDTYKNIWFLFDPEFEATGKAIDLFNKLRITNNVRVLKLFEGLEDPEASLQPEDVIDLKKMVGVL